MLKLIISYLNGNQLHHLKSRRVNKKKILAEWMCLMLYSKEKVPVRLKDKEK